jgi:hypothetical protein
MSEEATETIDAPENPAMISVEDVLNASTAP